MYRIYFHTKQRIYYCVVTLLLFIACHDTKDRAAFYGHEPAYSISDKGGVLQLDLRATGDWILYVQESGNEWCRVSPEAGRGNAVITLTIAPNYDDRRETCLHLQCGSSEEITSIVQNAHREDLTNVVKGRLEIPRLTGDTGLLFISHHVVYRNKTIPNYSMEYDLKKRHTRWVAFTAYDETAENNVQRTNIWSDDPDVPLAYRTCQEDYKGYDRGHLVASNDRRYCREANLQTFYYSNMSPQLADFNQKIWQKLEENIKGWMMNASLRDTLYIVKGGTIRDEQLLATTGENRVAVPKFYYMAILARKNNNYKAIAFWLEHKAYSFPYRLQKKALSIDELEKKTGIDFFPGLPDRIEDRVEATFDPEDWDWITP